jgi:hypothetical protein
VRSVPKVGSRIDGRVVAEVLERICRQAGFSEEDVAAIAARSLRAQFRHPADAVGMTAAQIGAVTGQKDPRTIARYAFAFRRAPATCADNPKLCRSLASPIRYRHQSGLVQRSRER